MGFISSSNMVIDNNEIITRHDGLASPLYLNIDSGDIIMGSTGNGRVGIGTSDPVAMLHLANGNVLFSRQGPVPTPAGAIPAFLQGSYQFWYADKAAFRVGFVSSDAWAKDNIGSYSTGAGRNVRAFGQASVAMGDGSEASGANSVAMGLLSTAAGASATAIGNDATASGIAAVAMGLGTAATGNYSTALGQDNSATGSHALAAGDGNIASGAASVALGAGNTAGGAYSFAMGTQASASGSFSVALGRRVNTNNQNGCFFFGDADPHLKGVLSGVTANRFYARFNGGFEFITSNAAANIGVQMAAGQNAWQALSDVNLKENFQPTDGEAMLEKIAEMPLTTWNYKGQDPKTFRHYGPMAQDFYEAFGKDDYGTIGCDTLINQQDFLGVNLVAIQALEKRTTALQEQLGKTERLLENALQKIEALESTKSKK
jgi:Chaperone of endosialidase/Head domain of trimeric autotransporter adhesin